MIKKILTTKLLLFAFFSTYAICDSSSGRILVTHKQIKRPNDIGRLSIITKTIANAETVHKTYNNETVKCSQVKSSNEKHVGLGFLAAAIAVVFFGSNYVPVKKFETGDGVFFQWINCSAIWIVGLVVNGFLDWPKFQPFAMLGGILWATGNICSVPVIKTIGLAQGLLIWGASCMLTGWFSAEFGILGVESQRKLINHQWLNILGVVIALLSLITYFFVDTNVSKANNLDDNLNNDNKKKTHGRILSSNADDSLLDNVDEDNGDTAYKRMEDHVKDKDYLAISNLSPRFTGNSVYETPNPNEYNKLELAEKAKKKDNFIDRMPVTQRKTFGILGAVLSGIFYGTNFNPPQYLIDHAKININDQKIAADCKGENYIFSHFCGIYLASTIYFLIYCAIMKNRPNVYPRAILPGSITGIMWAIAQTSWFTANDNLGMITAFPIVTTLPGLIASIWGVCLFKEITGKKNLRILSVAFILTVFSVVCITLSKLDI